VKKTCVVLTLALCCALTLGVAGCGTQTTTATVASQTSVNSATTTTEVANTWIELHPLGDLPPARSGAAMVYDSGSGNVILLGGSANGVGLMTPWSYDLEANTWTRLTSQSEVQPPARSFESMVYDSTRHKMILFGGATLDGKFLDDTWAYDLATNTWTNLDPTGRVPSGRAGHSMAYDPASGMVILFGGRFGDSGFLHDTWTYDPAANTWTKLHPTGERPVERALHSMVYDPASGKVILCGGWNRGTGGNTVDDDIWAYDRAANTWTQIPVSRPSFGESSPMVYDPTSGRVILRAWCDTWAYDSVENTLTNLEPEGAVPTSRVGYSMVYDPVGGRMVLFGGEPTGHKAGYLNDIWVYYLPAS
jgi:hypothetical protein